MRAIYHGVLWERLQPRLRPNTHDHTANSPDISRRNGSLRCATCPDCRPCYMLLRPYVMLIAYIYK